jgi:hypothetical protein
MIGLMSMCCQSGHGVLGSWGLESEFLGRIACNRYTVAGMQY